MPRAHGGAARRLSPAGGGRFPATGPRASRFETFEPILFNNLVVVLDGYFVYRTRGIEGKDGNPLNEVRMLSHSIFARQGPTARRHRDQVQAG